jgi:hypothetical protein
MYQLVYFPNVSSASLQIKVRKNVLKQKRLSLYRVLCKPTTDQWTGNIA